ncbi:phage tail termination protein [Biostraticola tofi]|uniref:Uncharacterized protein n=1 Tax=Biostraticola tofi TaxID=466109 RepID=A0A4R3Z5N5_9GAMM|nr:hypothetical protein [Biostraticola tofi]TCW00389.1 hypothetical protein EDC52_101739 [Biostraticola tofi]
MTPPMHKRVRNWMVDAGLTDNFIVQVLAWNDTGKLADRFIVFRPNGGANIHSELAAEYYVLVDVVSAKGVTEFQRADDTVQAIIQYVQDNPQPNDCIGYIENLGGIPSPVQTTEGRLVYRLQFAVTYGE